MTVLSLVGDTEGISIDSGNNYRVNIKWFG